MVLGGLQCPAEAPKSRARQQISSSATSTHELNELSSVKTPKVCEVNGFPNGTSSIIL